MTSTRPFLAAFASMAAVQLGAAIIVPAFDRIGPVGATWLRMLLAGAVLCVVARPRREHLSLGTLALGVTMAVATGCFAEAVHRVPLGVVVSIEFCGPLAVAAFGSRGARKLVWPALALAGVLLLVRPWSDGDLAHTAQTWFGLALAVAAGAGWAGYILLSAHVGRRSEGFAGLAVGFATAGVVLAPVGLLQAGPGLLHLDAGIALRVVAAAALVPLASYVLEMWALRHVDSGTFGVWMALEPALGALAGFAVLSQSLSPGQLPGLAAVVLAGVAAARQSVPDSIAARSSDSSSTGAPAEISSDAPGSSSPTKSACPVS